jgi:hypothetical protein
MKEAHDIWSLLPLKPLKTTANVFLVILVSRTSSGDPLESALFEQLKMTIKTQQQYVKLYFIPYPKILNLSSLGNLFIIKHEIEIRNFFLNCAFHNIVYFYIHQHFFPETGIALESTIHLILLFNNDSFLNFPCILDTS